jgi:beta-galactosidase
VDADVHVRMGGYPAPFREILGLQVEEFAPFTAGSTNSISTDDGCAFEVGTWADVVQLSGAEALATFDRDFYAGRPAVTRHRSGAGSAFYLATMPDEAGLAWLMARACHAAGVAGGTGGASSVEVVRRTARGRSWLFIINHAGAPVDVPLDAPGVDLVTGAPVEALVHVPPLDLAIVRIEEPPRAAP